jgi:ferric-dicitrate binding protein FerR (iron transport regulator)
MLDNYREPEELLSDESFLAWYFKTGEGQAMAWEHWMAANPGSSDLIQQAVAILDTTRILPDTQVPAPQIDRAEAALLQKIGPRTVSLYKDRRWIAAACVLVLFTTGLFITRSFRSRRPEVKTEYGQISLQQLPDGTDVTLNANSKLSYTPGWKDGADREVWVNGEAFFHVRRTPQKSRFIVHTDHFDIIVTGTQFNVVNRGGKNNILLQEGSVILHSPDGRELNMVPGDFVEFNSAQLEKRPAKNDSVLAWKEQKLVFDRTPLRELVAIIKDHYGIDVKLADDSLGDKKIVAILPNNNLDVLLRSLEATSEFDVVRQKEGGILIKAHAQDKN